MWCLRPGGSILGGQLPDRKQAPESALRDGLLTRTVTPTVPVTVRYDLTPLGRSLHLRVRELKGWAEEHMDEVLAHRGEYDAREG